MAMYINYPARYWELIVAVCRGGGWSDLMNCSERFCSRHADILKFFFLIVCEIMRIF